MIVSIAIIAVLFVVSANAQFLGKASSTNNDEVVRYAATNSLRLTPEQTELMRQTQQSFGEMMMSGPQVVNLNQLLIRAINANKVLDVGTYTGFSALSAALAMRPGGQVLTMDVNGRYFDQVGKPIAQRAGIGNRIRQRVQPAQQTMQELINSGESGTWDFCYIDADKNNQGTYYEQCLQLLRSGGIITLDNTLWGGSVARTPESQMFGSLRTIHELNKKIQADQRVHVSLLPMSDGYTIVLKK